MNFMREKNKKKNKLKGVIFSLFFLLTKIQVE